MAAMDLASTTSLSLGGVESFAPRGQSLGAGSYARTVRHQEAASPAVAAAAAAVASGTVTGHGFERRSSFGRRRIAEGIKLRPLVARNPLVTRPAGSGGFSTIDHELQGKVGRYQPLRALGGLASYEPPDLTLQGNPLTLDEQIDEFHQNYPSPIVLGKGPDILHYYWEAVENGKLAAPDGGVLGHVHSIESFTAVDGPGIRAIMFLQGCLRRCIFCCNPDTWGHERPGDLKSSKQVGAFLAKFKPYFGTVGGVTLSGGEPLMQPEFVKAVFQEAHALGITTCVDTAGFGTQREWDTVLPYADSVLLCVKALDPEVYFKVTGTPIDSMLGFSKALAERNIPLFVRYVLLDNITDTPDAVTALIEYAKNQPNVQAVELLPYHRLGENKWEEMKVPYPMRGVEAYSHVASRVHHEEARAEAIRRRLEENGIKVQLV